ncbi:MerR family transcriptional regulator [Pseudoruegeria sp. HB172150]|uniref:MerR family transcriptional regulator n=1 Tax=Pseudoruegeria sp. HB172150 TaxID=2721164 RepID=UPI0020A6D30C|nr:MerR family transcriptional regulator [Pseudoruegeria sp. HB172150]
MDKSPDAFRTISEVADWLGTPTHVLRFWESRFTQIKPVKRAGGRRYYRPNDMALLGGIKKLLHDDGLTIRGVQKILRTEGVKHVAALSQPLDGSEEPEPAEASAATLPDPVPPHTPAPTGETVNPFAASTAEEPAVAESDRPPAFAATPAEPKPEPEPVAPSVPFSAAPEPPTAEPEIADTPEPAEPPAADEEDDQPSFPGFSHGSAQPAQAEPETPAPKSVHEPAPASEPMQAQPVQPYDLEHSPEPEPATDAAAIPEPPRPAPLVLPEAAAIPDGPTIADEVLERLRAGAKAPPEHLLPIYRQLAELRDRMDAEHSH